MSVKVSSWTWQHSRAKGPELLVLLAIADSADDEGLNAWPSVARLGRKVRMSDRTVQRHIRALVQLGELEVTEPGGGRISNTYAVTMRGDNLTPVTDSTPVSSDTPGVADSHPTPVKGDTAGVSLLSPKTSSGRPMTAKRRPRAGSAGLKSSGRPSRAPEWDLQQESQVIG